MPMVIVGSSLLERSDGAGLLNEIKKICKGNNFINPSLGWNGFNVLHKEASRVGALDIGLC
jgi:hypothetical protein